MDENEPRDPHPGLSFGVTLELLSSYVRAVGLDERLSRAAAASQYESIELARAFAVGAGRLTREFAERSLVAELATTLGVHEATASTLLHEAEALMNHFPDTLHSLGHGSISRQHVRLLLQEAWSLPPEMRGAFEQSALPLAESLPPTRFRREARKLRERMHSDSIAERLRHERAERHVRVEPGRDGMSWITLYLPTDQAAAISARLDFMGRRTESDDDPRTRAQREADIASDLLQHGTIDRDGATNGTRTAGVGSVRPTVFVTVPVLTLLGLAEEPGSLEGFGPIDPDTARQLAGDAQSFFRILTHPEKGTWMSYGRDAYKVPADLQRFIRLRDGVCRFPGCTHRAITGENDHTVDWKDGGITSVENLASLCKKHHRLKHNSDWQVAQLADGIIEWTSPAGRTYRTSPDSSFGGEQPVPLDVRELRARARARAGAESKAQSGSGAGPKSQLGSRAQSGSRSGSRTQSSARPAWVPTASTTQRGPKLAPKLSSSVSQSDQSPLGGRSIPRLPRRSTPKAGKPTKRNDDDPPF